MQARLFAAVEVVTVFGFSIAAAALLATGLVGALMPAESPARVATAEVSKIARLPAIVVIGSRLPAAGEAAPADSASNAQTAIYRLPAIVVTGKRAPNNKRPDKLAAAEVIAGDPLSAAVSSEYRASTVRRTGNPLGAAAAHPVGLPCTTGEQQSRL